MPEIARTGADPRAAFFDQFAKADPLQMARAVGCDQHAGANLAQRRGLLVNRYRKALGDEGICREQAADAATDNRDLGFCHLNSSPLPKNSAPHLNEMPYRR